MLPSIRRWHALVEIDMHAHMNPTPMEAIKELADSFASGMPQPVHYAIIQSRKYWIGKRG